MFFTYVADQPNINLHTGKLLKLAMQIANSSIGTTKYQVADPDKGSELRNVTLIACNVVFLSSSISHYCIILWQFLCIADILGRWTLNS